MILAASLQAGCASTRPATRLPPLDPAQEQPFTPASFRAHHAEIREHLGHIDTLAQRLADEAPAEQRDTMRFVARFPEEHILTHASDEARTLYPRADATAGAAFPRSKRYEHAVVSAWVK